MRIVVIDDGAEFVEIITEIVRKQGHEVMAIAVTTREEGARHCIQPAKITVFAKELGYISDSIRGFEPDFVFIDHSLNVGGAFTGKDIADGTGLSADRFIGTSSDPQPYCGSQMPVHKSKLARRGPQAEFQAFIQKITGS